MTTVSRPSSAMSRILLAIPEDVRRAVRASLLVAPIAVLVGMAVAFVWPKHYLSTGSFIAETHSARSLPSSLGALADQFGGSTTAGGGQSPAFFADLLDSRAI